VAGPSDHNHASHRGSVLLVVVETDDESAWHWYQSTSGREGWVPSRTLRLDVNRA
jgi:hypothetical protein